MQRRVASLRLFNFYSRLNYNKLQFSIPYSLALLLSFSVQEKEGRGRGGGGQLFPFFCNLQFALRNALSFPTCRFSIAYANRDQSRAEQPAGPDLNVDIAHTPTHTEWDRESERGRQSEPQQAHNKNWQRIATQRLKKICDLRPRSAFNSSDMHKNTRYRK